MTIEEKFHSVTVTVEMIERAFIRLHKERSIELTTYWFGWNHPVKFEGAARHMFELLLEERAGLTAGGK